MENSISIRDSIINGITEIVNDSIKNGNRITDTDESNLDSSDLLSNSELGETVKYYVESCLKNQIENSINEIGVIEGATWKVDAHNVTKIILDCPEMSCMKENLNNILERCIHELTQSDLCLHNEEANKFKNFSTADGVGPLLQPHQFLEIAECLTSDKVLNIRIEAFKILLFSQLSDAVSYSIWPVLQQSLQENLNDENLEIFHLCLKAHAKLVSSLSPEAMKEGFLNLLESLGCHYHLQQTEHEKLMLTNKVHYRMVYISSLVLDTIKDTTQNVARFGETRLEEMIDNLVHLLSIHAGSKSSKNVKCLSPYYVFSCIDPLSTWSDYLTHSVITRNMLFTSMSRNTSLLRAIVEDIITWFTTPFSANNSNVTSGEISAITSQFSSFAHSFMLFSRICMFSKGRSLFPICLNKNEDPVTIHYLINMIIMFMNKQLSTDQAGNLKLSKKFLNTVVEEISKLLCIKDNVTSNTLQTLLEPLEENPPKIFNHTLHALDYIIMNGCQNILLKRIIVNHKKVVGLIQSSNSDSVLSAGSHRTNRQKPSYDQHSSAKSVPNLHVSPRVCSALVAANALIKVLQNIELYKVEKTSRLIKICMNLFKTNDGMLTLVMNKSTIVQDVITFYKIATGDAVTDRTNTSIQETLKSSCEEFLLHISTTPMGFYAVQEQNMIDSLLLKYLQQPVIPWSSEDWRLFLMYSTTHNTTVLAKENTNIVKQELLSLWQVIETDCSGSEIYIEEELEQLMSAVLAIGSSLKGVRALFAEKTEGSDVTVTDQTEFRPTNIASLIHQFALIMDVYDTIYHHIALSVLHLFISSLDINLYLLHTLQFQEHLLQLQSDNRVEESSTDVIVDECSVLRHRILEQSYLPRHCHSETKLYYIVPRHMSTVRRIKARSRVNTELTRFLQETRSGLHDGNWVKQVRKAYRSTNCSEDIKGLTIIDLLDQILKVTNDANSCGIKWQNTEAAEKVTLFPEELLGVQFAVRYGSFHRLIQHTPQNADNLTHLLSLIKMCLGKNEEEYSGFDWFSATVYLLCSGSVEKCQNFLSSFTSLPVSIIVWSQLWNDNTMALVGHLVENIIYMEVPSAFYVFQQHGISWWLLCRRWISECFWNVLEWNQICHWLTICILYQADYVIYFCVSLLYICESRILQLVTEGKLHQLFINPTEKLQLSDMVPYMDKLWKKHHSNVYTQLMLILQK